jgi:mono/diheme cytochrome c family protein
MEGTDLSRVGITGYDAEWYPKHLAKAAQDPAPAWKNFAPVVEMDRARLAMFLATRVGASRLVDAKAVFHSSGCMGCHKVSGVGGDEGPELSRAGEKDPGQIDFAPVPEKPVLANWLGEHFRSPGGVVAGSQMPVLGLGEDEIDALTMYVLSLRRRDMPATYTPRDRVKATRFGEREFATDGATIFGAFCAGCHGADGLGRRSPGMAAFPAIAGTDFQSRASDVFVRETITHGRPGRRMPAWGEISGGLKPDEIARVVGYLRSMSGVSAKPEPAFTAQGDAEMGKQFFAASCSGCHGRKGEGGEGPALNNRVLLGSATDTFLVETITNGRKGTGMPAMGEPSTVHRTYSRTEIEAIVSYLRTWAGSKK